MTDRQFKHAVYIGRFSPVHRGHLSVIQKALEVADRVIIVIGSHAKPRTPKNPWTSEERQKMIEASLGTLDFTRVKFVYVRDRYNYSLWTKDVQAAVTSVNDGNHLTTCLVGHRKIDTEYLDAFPQWQYIPAPLMNMGEISSSTAIRDILFSRDHRVEAALKEGVQLHLLSELDKVMKPGAIAWLAQNWILEPQYSYTCNEWLHYKDEAEKWSVAPHPVTFNTVDSVIIRSGHVLMVRRKFHPGKGLLALPGGHLNPREWSVDGSIREQQKEEAKMDLKCLGLKQASDLKQFIKGRDFFEHPDRSERHLRVITFAYLYDLGSGPLPKLKAGDDAESAHWIPISEIEHLTDQTFEDHSYIIESMLNQFGAKF